MSGIDGQSIRPLPAADHRLPCIVCHIQCSTTYHSVYLALQHVAGESHQSDMTFVSVVTTLFFAILFSLRFTPESTITSIHTTNQLSHNNKDKRRMDLIMLRYYCNRLIREEIAWQSESYLCDKGTTRTRAQSSILMT